MMMLTQRYRHPPQQGHPLWHFIAFWQRGTDGMIRCAVCYRAWPQYLEDNLTVDRIVPRKEGGKYQWNNMLLMCSTCNSVKSDRSLTWAREYWASCPDGTALDRLRHSQRKHARAARKDPEERERMNARDRAYQRSRYHGDTEYREKIKALNRANYREHRERKVAQKREYYEKNRDAINARDRERRATDPEYRARKNARSLRSYHARKASGTAPLWVD